LSFWKPPGFRQFVIPKINNEATMTAAVLQPQAVRTILNYHLEPERGGAEVWCPGTVRDKRRPHEHQEVFVTNIRGHESEFSLDKQGFHVGPFHPSFEGDLGEDAKFREEYYPEVAAHVKKMYVPGSSISRTVTDQHLPGLAHQELCQ
jgi:hypothetical protein